MTLELVAFIAVCWFVLVPSLITGLALRRARFREGRAQDAGPARLRCEGRTRLQPPVRSRSRGSIALGE